MAPAFFLCYRREDAGWALGLSGALEERHGRERVFKDITALALAEDWRAQVVAGLDSCTHVVAVIGPGWMDGVDIQGRRNGRLDPIVFELTEAMARRRPIFPVLVGRMLMPSADQLPHPLRPLAELPAAYVRPESADYDVDLLVDQLPQPTPVVRPDRGAAVTRPRRHWPAVVFGLVVAIAVVFGVITVVSRLGILGPAPELTLVPGEGRASTTISATATGFNPGATIRFRFHATPITDVTANADGTATTSFRVPADYARFGPMTWTVQASEEDSIGLKRDDALFTVTR